MLTLGSSLEEASVFMGNLNKEHINIVPWPLTGMKPEVKFTIAHAKDCIVIKYNVTEENVLARYKNSNEPVYKDSCVEFFISLDNNDKYYNFEFNAAGTCLMGFGPGDRAGRQNLSSSVIENIKRKALINSDARKAGPAQWELTVMIPFTVFSHHVLNSLKGKTCRANFHKCGDELPSPHYLVWNDIKSAEPDFHLPQFFGQLVFSASYE
jgi:hypothetical protein